MSQAIIDKRNVRTHSAQDYSMRCCPGWPLLSPKRQNFLLLEQAFEKWEGQTINWRFFLSVFLFFLLLVFFDVSTFTIHILKFFLRACLVHKILNFLLETFTTFLSMPIFGSFDNVLVENVRFQIIRNFTILGGNPYLPSTYVRRECEFSPFYCIAKCSFWSKIQKPKANFRKP